jgi:hypothetical protein
MEVMNINAEVQKLRQNRLMQQDGQYILFEEAIERIMAAKNVEHIPLLCQGFDDATEHHEVMFGLIHAVEEYHKISTPLLATEYFIKAIPEMLPHASDWAEIMLTRFLHRADDRRILRDSLKNTDTNNRIKAVSLLQKIASDKTGSFQQEVDEVLS